MHNTSFFQLRGVVQCFRCLPLRNTKALLAATLQPAFSLNLCHVSPRLLWQWFSLVVLVLVLCFYSQGLIPSNPDSIDAAGSLEKQNASSICIPESPFSFPCTFIVAFGLCYQYLMICKHMPYMTSPAALAPNQRVLQPALEHWRQKPMGGLRGS